MKQMDAELLSAVENGRLRQLRSLLAKGANKDVRDPASGNTALNRAIVLGDTVCARALIKAGCRVDVDVPLHYAAFRGQVGVVKALLNAGAAVNAKTRYGRSALEGAVLGGHVAIAELLLQRGADANTQNNSGWTPLMRSAREGDLPAAQLLLSHGADPNIRNREDQTALTLVVALDEREIADALREAGAIE